MERIYSINKIQNNLVFEMHEKLDYDATQAARVTELVVDCGSADDEIELTGHFNDINTGGGNDAIKIKGNNNSINTGSGNDNVKLDGLYNKVKLNNGNNTVEARGKFNEVTATTGNNNIALIGKGNKFKSADGNNSVLALGDGNNIKMGNGSHNVAYYGDWNYIKIGNGYSKVMTMDHALTRNLFTEYEDEWISGLERFGTGEEQDVNITYNYNTSTNPIYYELSEADKKYAENIDLTETINAGIPKYVIGADKNGIVTLYKYSFTYKGQNFYYPPGKEGIQSEKVVINGWQEQETKFEGLKTYNWEHSKNYVVEGGRFNQITTGDGNMIIENTVANGTNKVTLGTAITGHTIKQETDYTFAQKDYTYNERYFIKTKKFYVAR